MSCSVEAAVSYIKYLLMELVNSFNLFPLSCATSDIIFNFLIAMGIRVFDSDGDQSIWYQWGSEYLIAVEIVYHAFYLQQNHNSDNHERCQHGIDRVVIWFTSACDITWSCQSDSGSKQDGFLWLLRIPEPIQFYHLPEYCLFKKS